MRSGVGSKGNFWRLCWKQTRDGGGRCMVAVERKRERKSSTIRVLSLTRWMEHAMQLQDYFGVSKREKKWSSYLLPA